MHFILDRKRFLMGDDDDYAFGIDRLIDEGAYIAAYPLHDVSNNNQKKNHTKSEATVYF